MDAPMSDTLRTRIAAALTASAAIRGLPRQEADMRFMADAVIAELNLQSNLAKRIINGKPDQWVRRHVTDWEIVE
jgi:hypothetical protein